jgi:hypothetical protein
MRNAARARLNTSTDIIRFTQSRTKFNTHAGPPSVGRPDSYGASGRLEFSGCDCVGQMPFRKHRKGPDLPPAQHMACPLVQLGFSLSPSAKRSLDLIGLKRYSETSGKQLISWP